jgi:hypothetical protein
VDDLDISRDRDISNDVPELLIDSSKDDTEGVGEWEEAPDWCDTIELNLGGIEGLLWRSGGGGKNVGTLATRPEALERKEDVKSTAKGEFKG